MSLKPLKAAVKRLAATSPGWALSRLVRPRGTLVLMYHRVGPEHRRGFRASTSRSFGSR